MTPSADPSDDPAAAIAAALARLRGRRGPRPWPGQPWAMGESPDPHGNDSPGNGPHGPHGHDPRGQSHRGGPWAWGPGRMPPWAGPHGRGGGGPARLRLLEALVSAESLTVSEVAEAIGVDQPRATRLVQQGVDLGFVRREADPDDARRTRVVLTDEGRRIARAVRGERREAVEEALAGFTDGERTELARLLGKLADAWPAG